MSHRRTAAKRDANEPEIVEVLRTAGASVRRLSEKGVPDLIVGIDGVTYLLEVKDKRGTLTDEQIEFFNEWQGHKAIVRTPQEALRVIGR